VNPISTPKWLSVLDLAIIPVGAIALAAVGLRSLRGIAGKSAWARRLALPTVLALVFAPVLFDAQGQDFSGLRDLACLVVMGWLGLVLADLALRRFGTHAASLQTAKGLYGSFNPTVLAGIVAVCGFGWFVYQVSSLVLGSVAELSIALVWQLLVGRVVRVRQDRELGLHAERKEAMFGESFRP